MKKNMSKRNGLGKLLAGVGIGVGLGLLFAPKSGEETRKDLTKQQRKDRLEELIEARTGINTMTAEDPMTAVAIGTGKYVEFLA